MAEVGIRALKQNASAVASRAAAGDTVMIADRGRPVAQLTAIPKSRLQALIEAGRATTASPRPPPPMASASPLPPDEGVPASRSCDPRVDSFHVRTA